MVFVHPLFDMQILFGSGMGRGEAGRRANLVPGISGSIRQSRAGLGRVGVGAPMRPAGAGCQQHVIVS